MIAWSNLRSWHILMAVLLGSSSLFKQPKTTFEYRCRAKALLFDVCRPPLFPRSASSIALLLANVLFPLLDTSFIDESRKLIFEALRSVRREDCDGAAVENVAEAELELEFSAMPGPGPGPVPPGSG